MVKRKRIKYGEWYKIVGFGPAGQGNIAACPIKRVENNKEGQKIYKCKTVNHQCSNWKNGTQKCSGCAPKEYTCWYIGYIGPKIPKIKAKLLYENYTI